MSTQVGSQFFGGRLNNWLRRPRPTDPNATRRADLDSSDPYAILGLPAHPAPNLIQEAYEELRLRFAQEAQKLEHVTMAYLEICRRQGAHY